MQSQTDAQTPGNLWTKKNGLRDIHSHTQGAKKILKGRSQSSHEKETLKNREARPGRVCVDCELPLFSCLNKRAFNLYLAVDIFKILL